MLTLKITDVSDHQVMILALSIGCRELGEHQQPGGQRREPLILME
jgi:hypothetical protein